MVPPSRVRWGGSSPEVGIVCLAWLCHSLGAPWTQRGQCLGGREREWAVYTRAAKVSHRLLGEKPLGISKVSGPRDATASSTVQMEPRPPGLCWVPRLCAFLHIPQRGHWGDESWFAGEPVLDPSWFIYTGFDIGRIGCTQSLALSMRDHAMTTRPSASPQTARKLASLQHPEVSAAGLPTSLLGGGNHTHWSSQNPASATDSSWKLGKIIYLLWASVPSCFKLGLWHVSHGTAY